jgi:hypothetical protein
MRWSLYRLSSGQVLLQFVLTPDDSDAVRSELVTGDESPVQSKLAWQAFEAASSRRRNLNTYESDGAQSA